MAHDICSHCGTLGTLIECVTKTTRVDYFRCTCGQLWSVHSDPDEPTVRVINGTKRREMAPFCTPCGQQTRLLPVASNSAWVDYYRCDTCGTVLACEKNSSTVIHVSALLCSLCAGEGWICEEHPSKSWPHDDCQSLGAPCPMCQHLNDSPAPPADWRLLTRLTTSNMSCTCEGERWVCEQHPSKPFPHDDCAGPGMPCPLCNTAEPPARPPGWQSIIPTDH